MKKNSKERQKRTLERLKVSLEQHIKESAISQNKWFPFNADIIRREKSDIAILERKLGLAEPTFKEKMRML